MHVSNLSKTETPRAIHQGDTSGLAPILYSSLPGPQHLPTPQDKSHCSSLHSGSTITLTQVPPSAVSLSPTSPRGKPCICYSERTSDHISLKKHWWPLPGQAAFLLCLFCTLYGHFCSFTCSTEALTPSCQMQLFMCLHRSSGLVPY